MNPIEELIARVPLIEEKLNYSFTDKQLLILLLSIALFSMKTKV